jgi:hypothetical protein
MKQPFIDAIAPDAACRFLFAIPLESCPFRW